MWLKKIYKNYGDNSVITDLSIEIKEEKLTILKGRSGSGKTTLLNIIGLLDNDYSGQVVIDGTIMDQKNRREIEKVRRYQFGYVFQYVALIDELTAYENIEFALRLSEYHGDYTKRIHELLDRIGLMKRKNHFPYELSGGEAARVGIARAIAGNPKFLLADEPTAALDTETGLQVMKLFKKLIEEEKLTIVMATHDNNLMQYGDYLYNIEDGIISNGEKCL